MGDQSRPLQRSQKSAGNLTTQEPGWKFIWRWLHRDERFKIANIPTSAFLEQLWTFSSSHLSASELRIFTLAQDSPNVRLGTSLDGPITSVIKESSLDRFPGAEPTTVFNMNSPISPDERVRGGAPQTETSDRRYILKYSIPRAHTKRAESGNLGAWGNFTLHFRGVASFPSCSSNLGDE